MKPSDTVTMADENTNTQDTATVTEDLPQEIIIIVGCICGSIVIILTIVLIVLCCKRHKSKQQYEKQSETRMSPVLDPSPSPDSSDISKPPVKSGLDNPGLDQPDNAVVDMDRSHDGPFVTHSSGHNPNLPYDTRKTPSADAHGHQWNGHNNYDHQHQHQHDQHQHQHSNQYAAPPSYPDGQNHEENIGRKPKKIIHEVVV